MAISKVSSSFGLSKALKILLRQCELIREGLTPLNSASNAFSLPRSKPIGAKCFQHLLLKRKTILFDSWVKCKKNLKLASVLIFGVKRMQSKVSSFSGKQVAG